MSLQPQKVETLKPTDVSRMLEEGGVLMIDVREPAEYAAHMGGGLAAWNFTGLPIIALGA